MTNEEYMSLANDYATLNKENNYKHGGPFGAIITDDKGNIIAKAKNEVLKNIDPTAHAEINAIRMATQKLKTIDLHNCTLYTSCYPCPMCLGAIMWANIKTVYYGNTMFDAELIGFKDKMIYEFLENNKSEKLSLEQINRDITIKSFDEFTNNKEKIMY